MKRTALGLLALPFLFLACAEPEAPSAASDTSEAISDSKVKLPSSDDCRDVLAPLALGLAESAVGLDYATSITVSLTSETDTRLYTVSAVSPWYTASFEVELDNDSASKCLLLSAVQKNDAKLASDAKSKLKHGEANVTDVTVTPSDDDCAAAVKLLAGAARASSNLVPTTVTLTGEDENRYYRVQVGNYGYDLETSNDSASKCWVQDFRRSTY